MHAAAPNPLPPLRPSRRREMAVLVGAVVLAHGLLLRPPWLPVPGTPANPSRAMQVRQIAMPAVGRTRPAAGPAQGSPQGSATVETLGGSAAAADVVAAALAAPSLASSRQPGAAGPDAASRRPADVRAEPRERPSGEIRAPAAAQTDGSTAAAARGSEVEALAAPAPPGADGTPPPVYATRLPPPATLHYATDRGGAPGQATLQWLPADGRYRLTLERSTAGQPARGAVSQGELGVHGIAPVRHTESRSGRELRAANFQREAGRISFSGPSTQFPLQPGAQDRLSWMLQLPAVLEAEPGLREPGSEVRLFVAGTRGDGEVWTFGVQGRETVETPAGTVPGALHLRRLPSRPYDPQVDAWLDPARHHLPVRLLVQGAAVGGRTEFTLRQVATP